MDGRSPSQGPGLQLAPVHHPAAAAEGPTVQPALFDLDQLLHEHHALLRLYAQAQTRCGALVLQQIAEIESLRAQALRQRAAIIARDTALAWAREDRAALEAAIPGLPKRVVLAQRVESLMARVKELMRERLHWHRSAAVLP